MGVIGTLHPSVADDVGFAGAVCVCEIDLDALREVRLPEFKELSRFPEVRRDLALVVDRSVAAADLMADVRGIAGSYLVHLRLFDVYEGKGIDPKRKSLGLGLTFRDQSRTLSDEDVNKYMKQVLDLMKKNYNAELRS
jgi:phenylalanyl-tRNA synthetase beta chain